ncbi:WXG100 family type VII secretion target [Curtobacterium sp. NPDC090217]|uniref:WXG100 family type VII secretion target n=1 Tax=Curtobacterium sp. NPDC090217 TaxID=3363970 RepID=UPI003825057E
MTWTHDDPSQGSPAAIQGLAQLRSARAGKIRDAQQSLQGVGSGSGAEWKAMSQTAFASKLSADAADIELLATGLEAQASALKTYAGQLSQLQDRQRVLEQQRSSVQMDLGLAKMKLSMSNSELPALLKAETPDPDATAAAKRKSAAAQTAVDDAQAKSRAIDAQWEQLVADRRSMDSTCVAALQSRAVLGGLSQLGATTASSIAPDALLGILVGLSTTDLNVMLRLCPDLAKRIAEASPEAVAKWWSALGDSSAPNDFTDAQQWFIASMPAAMGALDGLAPAARVAANKLNAERRLKDDEARLAAINTSIALLSGHLDTSSLVKERDQLNAEIGYLRDATTEPPRVQLYLYDPDKSRIIEMIGTFGPETTNVVTYTPGTFADLNGFYSGQTQAMAQWLASRHADTVAFVYKDGLYPGETNPKSTMNLLRIGEANDPSVARDAGQRLADFQRGLNAGSDIARDARAAAIGHSWGLANVTSSEVEGAHYDTVVSLAGAGMPSQWEPSPTTKYVHEGYPDLLLEAQLTGKVWDGRIPLLDGSFEIHMHQGPKSVVDTHSVFGIEVKTLDQQALLDNHNLVAEASKNNREVLNEINQTIYGDR